MRRIHKLFVVGASSLLLAVALTPVALAAGTVSGGTGKIAAATYKGKTSQGKKIAFSVASGEATGTILWKAGCKPKSKLKSGTAFKAKVSHGKFSVSGSYKAPINNGQYEGHYRVSIAGKIKGRKAHGTFSGKSSIFKGSHEVATCKSGSVTWHATK